MVSNKQREILHKAGYSDYDINAMSYEQVSDKIGEILGSNTKKPQKTPQNAPMPQKQGNPETSVQIVKRERQNSYEFGRAGNRFKVYFEDKADLDAQLKELENFVNPIAEQFE